MQGNAEFLMIDEQKLVYETALDLAHRAGSGSKQCLIVKGGPGTGKSVVAINLLVGLTKREMMTQYVSRNFSEVGSSKPHDPEKQSLSEIIDRLSDLYGAEVSDVDKLHFTNSIADRTERDEVLMP